MSLKEAHESFSSNSRKPVHEDRRLQIEELNEWRTHKPRTPDKSKLCQNEPDTSPNQLKYGGGVFVETQPSTRAFIRPCENRHEDPPTQPPPPSHPVHAAASYANISERLTRFEQQCFQRFDNIDPTLQQIFQHLHISSPVPPREPSNDEDV
ncbi:hypothetical protein GOBAR_AA34968 [Gossypium barbadense]|uniref:Uncharacterized protein n=1 Tax=Gossypium barbadense TaxID=3634 RepID=A0A2P5W3U1_GOSBA|nr:hypothetical protein GOBAR_AA34968 [Gossypium barbadense]